MGYLSLEDIYPDDVHKYGHMRVGMTDLYVKDNHAAYVWLRVANIASSPDGCCVMKPCK